MKFRTVSFFCVVSALLFYGCETRQPVSTESPPRPGTDLPVEITR